MRTHPAGGYVYTDTRVRALKAALLPQDSYPKLLKMSPSEVTRFLDDNGYKDEIDELASRYSGVILVEYALMRNLAHTYQKVLHFSYGRAHELLSAYLDSWDVWNIKTVIRGKYAHAPEAEIASQLVPAGSYGEDFFKQLIATTNTVEDVVRALENTAYRDALADGMAGYRETRKLSTIEDSLDASYFSMVSEVAEGELADYIALEADMLNILMLLRFKDAGIAVSPGMLVSLWGRFSKDELMTLAARDRHEIIETVNRKFPGAELSADDTLPELASKLSRKRLLSARRLLLDHRFNINPVLGFLTAKRIEIDNLRMINRGKHAGLPAELIEKQLIT